MTLQGFELFPVFQANSLRQITPWRAGSQNPKDAVQHPAVVYAWHASRLVRQKRLDHAPFEVGQVKSAHAEYESENGVVWKPQPLSDPLQTDDSIVMIGTMAFDYQVSLQVYHPDADPAEIVEGLAIPASRSWKVGDRRSDPNGAQLSGQYRETYCLFRLGDGNDGELAKCLREAVKILQPTRQYLAWLRETGGRMNFYVGWTVGERGEVFDTRLLSEIAQLGIDLGIEPFRARQH